MTARLGISVSAEVHAVLVRNGRVVWRASTAIDRGDMESALGQLLESLPSNRFRGPKAIIAVGLAHCQVKPIDGIPAAASVAVLNRVVRENSSAFFLSTGRRLIITEVDRRTDGSVWAAAFDPDVIDAAVAALKRHGITTVSAIPSMAAIASLLPSGIHSIADGSLVADITTSDGMLIAHARRMGARTAESHLLLPDPLVAIGPEAAEFAAAFGAATAPASIAFRWRPAPSAQRSRAAARTRVVATALLLTSSLAGALAAPGTRITNAARAANRELANAHPQRTEARDINAELRRVSGELERVDQFEASRGAMTLLLGAIARALPESTALLNLRVDSLEGSFIALGPRVTEVLPMLAEVRGVVAPRIVGSVTREMQGSVRLERATFRFTRMRRGAK